MARSESSILNHFLLQPAPLPAILSLQTFTDLVPKGRQNHVQIKSLYRNLKSERASSLEQIKHNIDQECKRGERQIRQVIKARRQAEKSVIKGANIIESNVDDEISDSEASVSKKDSLHTLSSILPEMEQACHDLEADIAASEAESETTLLELGTMVENLSDLRYGRFSKPTDSSQNLQEMVRRGLHDLQRIREAKLEG